MNNNLAKVLELRSIDEKCNMDEKRVRRYIMNYIIEKGEIFNIEKGKKDLCRVLDLDENTYTSAIKNLTEKNVVAVDSDYVNFIYPVSAFQLAIKLL